jgi:hypothetical protein
VQEFTYGDPIKFEFESALPDEEFEVTVLKIEGVDVTEGFPLLNAGEYNVTVKVERPATATHLEFEDEIKYKLVINERPVRLIGLEVKDKEYDGEADAELALYNFNPEEPFDLNYVNFYGGDIIPGDKVQLVIDTDFAAEFDEKNVGEKRVITFTGLSLEGDDAGNYILAHELEPLRASITRREITIAPEAGQSKEFGDDDPELRFEFAAADGTDMDGTHDLFGDDNFSGKLAHNGENAGDDYLIVIGTLSAGNNYNLTVDGDVTFEITKATRGPLERSETYRYGTPHTIKISEIVKSNLPGYRGELLEYKITSTVSASGFFDSDPSVVNNGDLMLTMGSLLSEGQRTATITVEVRGFTNYVSPVIVELTINMTDKYPVTITGLTAQDGAYDGTEHDGYIGTPVFTGGSPINTMLTHTYSGRNLTVYNPTPTSTPPTNAGDYKVVLSLDDDTYFGSVEFNFTITPRPLTIIGATATKVYDGNNTAATAAITQLSGWVGDDETGVTVGTVTAVYNGINAGTNTINVSSVALSGGQASNYTVTPENNFTVSGGGITRRPLTIATATHTKVYDGNTNATGIAVAFEGILPADSSNVTVNSITGAYVNANVGSNINITSVTLGGSASGNYTVTPENNFTVSGGGITPRLLTITGATATKVYDGNNTAATAAITREQLSGWVGGDAVGVTVGTVAAVYNGINAGTNTINVSSVALSGGQASNYTVNANPSVSVVGITKATPTVETAPAASMVMSGVLLSTSELSGGTVNGVDGAILGEWKWVSGGEEVRPAPYNVFSARFTPTSSNYIFVDEEITVPVFDIIPIWNESDFENIRTNLGEVYRLMANITPPQTWTPFGTFTGIFDGNGHTINFQNSPTSNGLFHTNSGTVKNLGLVDVNISGDNFDMDASVGGVAGMNTFSGVIKNCYVTGVVEGGGWMFGYVGGIAGKNQGIIENCIALSSSIRANGIVGAAGRVVGLNDGGTLTNNSAWVNMVYDPEPDDELDPERHGNSVVWVNHPQLPPVVEPATFSTAMFDLDEDDEDYDIEPEDDELDDDDDPAPPADEPDDSDPYSPDDDPRCLDPDPCECKKEDDDDDPDDDEVDDDDGELPDDGDVTDCVQSLNDLLAMCNAAKHI